jgi:hypothetical protein
MSDRKVLSFDQVKKADTFKYDFIPYGTEGDMKVGTVSSGDILQWIAENEDPDKKKTSGLNLIAKSIVNEQNERLPADEREAFIEMLKTKDAKTNGTVVKAILKLNGLDGEAEKVTAAEVKND